MNTLEKKIVKTALAGLEEVENYSPQVSESISWLKALLPNNIGPRELVSLLSKANGCESVNLFLKELKLYPSKNCAPKDKELACFRICSKEMYSNYGIYCFDKGFNPMRAKNFKGYLKLKGFKYKKSIKIDGQVTSGYEFVMNKNTKFDNSVFVKEITF
ncbi:hypothetical protein PF672P2_00048 [Parabacteroides phage PF672P2]|nr:hypothetical protein PF672P2_00048 [Parabacteroides phage PF672P2]